MIQLALIAIDLAAIALLTFGVYFPRHRRRDLVVAYLCVNVGVLAVAEVLSSSAIGIGLGLGLFGVLSIIRLRSYEIGQHEVAYYFAALALGLIAGMSAELNLLTVGLMVLIVVVMLIGDNPALFRRYRQQTVTLDRAVANESEIRAILEKMLDARVHVVHVQKLDLVDDTTVVDVRYELHRGSGVVPKAPEVSKGSDLERLAAGDSPSLYVGSRA